MIVYTLSDARDWHPILLSIHVTREAAEAERDRRIADPDDLGRNVGEFTVGEYAVLEIPGTLG